MKITINKKSVTIRATEPIKHGPFTEYNDEFNVREMAEGFEAGSSGTLAAAYDHSPNSFRRGTSDDVVNVWMDDVDGVAGNSDRSIRSTSGWRGTTNDRAIYAHGVRTVKSVEPLKRGLGYRIVFGRRTKSA